MTRIELASCTILLHMLPLHHIPNRLFLARRLSSWWFLLSCFVRNTRRYYFPPKTHKVLMSFSARSYTYNRPIHYRSLNSPFIPMFPFKNSLKGNIWLSLASPPEGEIEMPGLEPGPHDPKSCMLPLNTTSR